MLAPVEGIGLVVYTFDRGAEGKVEGRPETSVRPVTAPGCAVPNEREGTCWRANETARASGATR